jgi:hypothetical protein
MTYIIFITDQEKIARMVEWMGGWPEHRIIRTKVGIFCTRVSGHDPDPRMDLGADECEGWNPFERIEDAFLLKARMMGKFETSEEFLDALHDMAPNNNVLKWLFQIQEPARAIAEAAWQAISRLNPDRGLLKGQCLVR